MDGGEGGQSNRCSHHLNFPRTVRASSLRPLMYRAAAKASAQFSLKGLP